MKTFILLLSLSSFGKAWLLIPSPRKAVVAVGGAVAATATALYLQKIGQTVPLYAPAPGSLQGQTILITGASTGMGLESAKRLAVGGASIVLTARTDDKGQVAVQMVQDYLREKHISNDNISYRILNLDDLQSIKDTVATWNDLTIDVLLNNAGVMALPKRSLTVDGYETQMQSNHLGHFLLTALLAPQLTAQARIINVSSDAHKLASATGLDFDYMWTAKDDSSYGGWKSYGQSKLANILFTQELQRRATAAGKDWTAVALHPGTVGTDLGRHVMGESYEKLKSGNAGFWVTLGMKAMQKLIKTPEQGATTQIWLAAGNGGDSVKGQYVKDCKVRQLGKFAFDKDAAARLWKESEERVGVSFDLERVLVRQPNEQEGSYQEVAPT